MACNAPDLSEQDYVGHPSGVHEECVWYCGSCYDCILKKNCFIKSTFS